MNPADTLAPMTIALSSRSVASAVGCWVVRTWAGVSINAGGLACPVERVALIIATNTLNAAAHTHHPRRTARCVISGSLSGSDAFAALPRPD
jgi:hypothetical protein